MGGGGGGRGGGTSTLDCGFIKEFSPKCRFLISYQQEVRRGVYLGLGVFMLQYFPLVKI